MRLNSRLQNLKNGKGSISVLAALSVFVLLLIIAVSINVGWMVYVRNQAQRSVDAAALAAAAALPSYADSNGHPTGIVEKLLQTFNGTDYEGGSNPVMQRDSGFVLNEDAQFINYRDNQIHPIGAPEQANGVRVSKTFTIPHFFGRVVGLLSTSTVVKATAVLGGVSCYTPTIPLAVLDCETSATENVCNMTEGTTGSLRLGSTGETAASFSPDKDPLSETRCQDLSDGNEDIPGLCSGTVVRLDNQEITTCLEVLKSICGANECDQNPWEVYLPVVSCNEIFPKPTPTPGGPAPTPVVGNSLFDARISGFAKIAITGVDVDTREISFVVRHEFMRGHLGGGQDCGLSASGPVLVQ